MSRHTEPMTDAYIAAERLRNEARVQCAIQQLGTRWVLHPDNAVTRESHLEARRERVEVIDTRRLREAGFATVAEAFRRATEAFCRSTALAASAYVLMETCPRRAPLLIENEGGAQ